MSNSKTTGLARFGFRFGKSSTHTARTMMLEDLKCLLARVSQSDSSNRDFYQAVVDENCLGKRSVKTRELTIKHLIELYALDDCITIFRALRYFWTRDVGGQPLIALLCTYARDDLLRISAPFIQGFSQNEIVSKEAFEKYIEQKFPNRFSEVTLKSITRNLNSTWTKSGHLIGKSKKIRAKAFATPGSVSYALFLGYLTGTRGEQLFNSVYVRLLDCTPTHAIELAEDASRRGWITFKRVGDVMEVLFPNLLTKEEKEWIYEQN